MVCTADPYLITLPQTSRVFILKCNTYLKRDPGDSLRPICLNAGPDGLFPGQLKPPIDYSDVDPDEELFNLEQELDIPHKDRFYNSTPPTPSCNT